MEQGVAGLWRQAESRFAQGNYREAGRLYEALVAAMPAHVPAWLRLSGLATAAGRYRDAAAAASRAASIRVDDPGLGIAVCARLVDVGETRRAHDLLAAIARAGDLPAQACAELAAIANRLGEAPQALVLAERAWQGGLRTPELAYLRATLLLFAGRVEDAEAGLEALIHAVPHLAGAHWTLSKLRRWSSGHNHVPRLREALARLPAGDPAEAYLCFALYKELEDCGRDADAWAALERGCAARRRAVHYDAAAEARLFAQLAAQCTPAFLQRAAPPPPGPVPVFIVGLPRSGTTVLERILGAHTQVHDAGELDDFAHALAWGSDHQAAGMLDEAIVARAPELDFGIIGQRYLANTRWRAQGRAFYTDKQPRNFQLLGYIRRALPHARILHMVRDPMDTCFSNLKELFGAAYPYSYDPASLAAHYGNYRRLMAHWHAAMPGAVLDVPYAELVAEPERVARAVFAHVGLDWEPGCLAIERRASASMTASSIQVREPIQRKYLGQWRRYERQLQPLRALLADWTTEDRDAPPAPAGG